MDVSSPSAPASAPQANSAAIPFKPEPNLQGHGIGLPTALLVCLLLFGVVVVLLRRRALPSPGTARPSRALQVLESRSLDGRVRVSVLRYRGKELLVAHSEHAVTVLAEDPAQPRDGGQQ